MDNSSLIDLADEISEIMQSLGLHLEGPPGIQGAIRTDETYDDEDSDDDDDDEPLIDINTLTDKLKSQEAMAVIHMTFSVNKLAFTERILHPERFIAPETMDDLDLGTSFMQEQIKARLEEGEELEDILEDLLGGGDKEGES